jgi:hypothetical protein
MHAQTVIQDELSPNNRKRLEQPNKAVSHLLSGKDESEDWRPIVDDFRNWAMAAACASADEKLTLTNLFFCQ